MVLAFAFLSFLRPSSHNFSEVASIVARANSPYSGIFYYDTQSRWPPQGKVIRQDRIRFVKSGENWILCSPPQLSSRRNFGGIYAQVHPGTDFQSIGGVQVEMGKPFIETPPAPSVAGTFWYASTRRFVEANGSKGVHKGTATLEDVSCDILEWRIAPAEANAFGEQTPTLISRGGILRVYAAPSLGYALPKVEYLSLENGLERVELVYEAFSFEEATSGVFLPRMARQRFFHGGTTAFECSLENISWEYVNEEIPDSAFKLHVPFRTIIVDLRGKKRQYQFETVAALPEDLRPLFSDTPIPPLPPPTPKPLLGAAGWIGIGAGVVVVLFLLVIFLRRSPARGGGLNKE